MAIDDSYTKLLLHCNGADASTTITDEAGKSVTAVGNAQIDTAQSKFGGASLLLDGTGDYLTVPDSADWQLDGGSNSNAWTIDFQIRFAADPTGVTCHILNQHVDTTNYWIVSKLSTNALSFRVRQSDTDIITINNNWSPSANTWYHVAIVKNGTTGYMMFINGTQIGTTQTDTSTIPNYAGILNIGRYGSSASGLVNGWMDEIRISKGIARWTANFTAPTNEYVPPSTYIPKVIWI